MRGWRLVSASRLMLAFPAIAAALVACAAWKGWLAGKLLWTGRLQAGGPSFWARISSGGVQIGEGVDRGAALAALAVPAFAAVWMHLALLAPMRRWARREVREGLALTLLPASAWLRRNFAAPLCFLALPALIALPILDATLRDHRLLRVWTSKGRFIPSIQDSWQMIRGPAGPANLPQGAVKAGVYEIYRPKDTMVLYVLAFSTLVIAATGLFASLERLCRRDYGAIQSIFYALAWGATAALMPQIVYHGLSLDNLHEPLELAPDFWIYYKLSIHIFPLGTMPLARWGSILFAAATCFYAAFWWRRLRRAYFKFD